MKYQDLQDLIENLTNKTTNLNSDDLKQDYSSVDFIKKVIEISTETIKSFKKFCGTQKNEDLKKYLTREFDLMLKNNQNSIKNAVDFSNGNTVVNLPLNISLSYNQAKNKTAEFDNTYENLIAGLKAETERKAKEAALNELHDLKFNLTNVQDRLENYDNKIADAF